MINTKYILQHSFSIDYDKVISEGYNLYVALSLMLFIIEEESYQTETNDLYKELILVYVNMKYQVLLYISLLSVSQIIQKKMMKLMVRYNSRLNKESTDELLNLTQQLHTYREVKKHIQLKGGNRKRHHNDRTKKNRGKKSKRERRSNSRSTRGQHQRRSHTSKKYGGMRHGYQSEILHFFKMFIIVWLQLSYFFLPIPAIGATPSNVTMSDNNITIPMTNYNKTSASNETLYIYISSFIWSSSDKKEEELSREVNKTLLDNQTKITDKLNALGNASDFLESLNDTITPENRSIAEQLLQNITTSQSSDLEIIEDEDEYEEEEEWRPPTVDILKNKPEANELVPQIMAKQPSVQTEVFANIEYYRPKKKEAPTSILGLALSMISPGKEEEIDGLEIAKREWASSIKNTQDLLENMFLNAQASCIKLSNIAKDLNIFQKEALNLIKPEVEDKNDTSTSYLPSIFSSTTPSPVKEKTQSTTEAEIDNYKKQLVSDINTTDNVINLIASQNLTLTQRKRFVQQVTQQHIGFCRDFVRHPNISLIIDVKEETGSSGLVPINGEPTTGLNAGAGIFSQRTIKLDKNYYTTVDVANFNTFIRHLENLQGRSVEVIERVSNMKLEKDKGYFGFSSYFTDNMTPELKTQVEQHQDLNEKIELLIRLLNTFQKYKRNFIVRDDESYIKGIIQQFNQSLTNDLEDVISFQETFKNFLPIETIKQEERRQIQLQELEHSLEEQKLKTKIEFEKSRQTTEDINILEPQRKAEMDARELELKNKRRKGQQDVAITTAYTSGVLAQTMKEGVGLFLNPIIALFAEYWLILLIGILGLGSITFLSYFTFFKRLFGIPSRIYSFFRYGNQKEKSEKKDETKGELTEGVVAQMNSNKMAVFTSKTHTTGAGGGYVSSKNSLDIVDIYKHDPNLKLTKLRDFYRDNPEFDNILFMMTEEQMVNGKPFFEKICVKFQGINPENNKIYIKLPESREDERYFSEEYGEKILDPIHNPGLYTESGDFTFDVKECKRTFQKKQHKRTQKLSQGRKVLRKSAKKLYTGESSSSSESESMMPVSVSRRKGAVAQSRPGSFARRQEDLEEDLEEGLKEEPFVQFGDVYPEEEDISSTKDITQSQLRNPFIEDKGRQREIGIRTEKELRNILTSKKPDIRKKMGKLSDFNVSQIADTIPEQPRDVRTSFGYPDEKQPGDRFEM